MHNMFVPSNTVLFFSATHQWRQLNNQEEEQYQDIPKRLDYPVHNGEICTVHVDEMMKNNIQLTCRSRALHRMTSRLGFVILFFVFMYCSSTVECSPLHAISVSLSRALQVHVGVFTHSYKVSSLNLLLSSLFSHFLAAILSSFLIIYYLATCPAHFHFNSLM